jgi:endonuclease/exonuclease/phosphatase (EEP) superfamily protein YafD
LFSRIPFEAVEIHRSQETRIPVYQVQMLIDGQRFIFVGGHPWPPQPQWGQLHRDQMNEIIKVAALASPPLIVAGDFNAAPWSYTMRHLAEQADVRQVRQGLDMTSTWRPLLIYQCWLLLNCLSRSSILRLSVRATSSHRWIIFQHPSSSATR